MIRIFEFILFICLTLSISAQEYHPFDTANISWYEREESGEPPNGIINKYVANGDTLINELKYFKIYQRTEVGDDYVGCYREDNKVIRYIGIDYFNFSSDTAVVLYDFNKTKGETISTGTWQNYTITSIDSVWIDDSYRKRFLLDDGQAWIEGIGSTYGFRYPMTAIPTCNWNCELTCFKKDDEIIYLNPGFIDCETVDYIQNYELIDNISIYPNPITKGEKISLISSNSIINKVVISNILGKTLLICSDKNKQKLLINTSELDIGVVFIWIETNKGVSHKSAIIKR